MKAFRPVLLLLVILLSIGGYAQHRIFLHTDQDVYAPGSTVYYKVYAAPEGSEERPVSIYLVNQDGGIQQEEKVNLTQSEQSGEFRLSVAFTEGLYKIVAVVNNQPIEYAFFKSIWVKTIDIPGLIIDLEKPHKACRTGENLILKTQFVGPDGKGIKRQRYNWNLLVNGEPVIQEKGKADREGKDMIEITYPAINENDLVSLTLSTEFYGSSYQSSVILPSVNMPLDIRFYPEGGLPIDGFETKYGLVARTLEGKALKIEGELITPDDEVIQEVSTGQSGYGLFTITPDVLRPLRLRIVNRPDIQATVDLPLIKSNGLVLRYTGVDQEEMMFLAINPVKNTYMSLQMIARQFGNELVTDRLLVQTEKAFSLPLNKFKPGLVYIHIFNDRGEIMGARTVVVPENKSATYTFESGSLSIADAVFSPTLGNVEDPVAYFATVPGVTPGLSKTEQKAFLLSNILLDQDEPDHESFSDKIENHFRQDFTRQFIQNIWLDYFIHAHFLDEEIDLPTYYSVNRAQLDEYNMLPKKLSQDERAQRMLDQGKPILSVIRSIRAYRIVNNQLVFRGGSDSFTDISGAVIVVDGVPKGADIGVLENMSPHDVSSIEISTSISDIMKYSGMEDTAGVVIINTRKAGEQPEAGSVQSAAFNPLIIWDPDYNEDTVTAPKRKMQGQVRISHIK